MQSVREGSPLTNTGTTRSAPAFLAARGDDGREGARGSVSQTREVDAPDDGGGRTYDKFLARDGGGAHACDPSVLDEEFLGLRVGADVGAEFRGRVSDAAEERLAAFELAALFNLLPLDVVVVGEDVGRERDAALFEPVDGGGERERIASLFLDFGRDVLDGGKTGEPALVPVALEKDGAGRLRPRGGLHAFLNHASSFDEDALFALLSCLKRGGKTCVAAAHHDEVGLNGYDADEGTGGEGTEQCDGGLLHGTSGKISGLDGARAP